MVIRPYQHKDQLAVIKLWEKAFPESPPWNKPIEDIRRKLNIQPELFLVAELEGGIIGTAMGGFDGHRGWVYYVAVHPDFRLQGIGLSLMEKIEQGLKSIGCTKLNLQVRSNNTAVIEFYKQLGYAVEDRISMAKRL
ncbi:MAG: GNAT family acetyltransferase [FCB group bacterium]|nr:GNAT family acetyltransferase [FCB group bacterium]